MVVSLRQSVDTPYSTFARELTEAIEALYGEPDIRMSELPRSVREFLAKIEGLQGHYELDYSDNGKEPVADEESGTQNHPGTKTKNNWVLRYVFDNPDDNRDLLLSKLGLDKLAVTIADLRKQGLVERGSPWHHYKLTPLGGSRAEKIEPFDFTDIHGYEKPAYAVIIDYLSVHEGDDLTYRDVVRNLPKLTKGYIIQTLNRLKRGKIPVNGGRVEGHNGAIKYLSTSAKVRNIRDIFNEYPEIKEEMNGANAFWPQIIKARNRLSTTEQINAFYHVMGRIPEDGGHQGSRYADFLNLVMYDPKKSYQFMLWVRHQSDMDGLQFDQRLDVYMHMCDMRIGKR
ncbi:MAG: hypothetical protein HYW24_05150 [Candidatus Aenigmarchaeota archaeon]|nr:hypothetical protein [Candidatus Aenigmarchaeota archaeon]